MLLNLEKAIKENISFQDILKNSKYKISLNLILIFIFSFIALSYFFYTKLGRADFILTLFVLGMTTIGLTSLISDNLSHNYLNLFDKKKFLNNPKKTIFDFFKSDISLSFFIQNNKQLEAYFKENNCEELYSYFIKEKFKTEHNLYYDYIPDAIYKYIINKNLINSKSLTTQQLNEFKYLITSVIDYWFEIEPEIINTIDSITFKSLKYDLITKNIDSFIELGNINTKNGRKVYDYFKSSNINNKYTHIFEQEVLFINNLSQNLLNNLNHLARF